jgi:hypothetical protein
MFGGSHPLLKSAFAVHNMPNRYHEGYNGDKVSHEDSIDEYVDGKIQPSHR